LDVRNARDFADHEALQAEGLRESVASIRQVVEVEEGGAGGD